MISYDIPQIVLKSTSSLYEDNAAAIIYSLQLSLLSQYFALSLRI